MRHTKSAPTLAMHHCCLSQGLRSFFSRPGLSCHATPVRPPRLTQLICRLASASTSVPAHPACHYKPAPPRTLAVCHPIWALHPGVDCHARLPLALLSHSVDGSAPPLNAPPRLCRRSWLRCPPTHFPAISWRV